MKYDILTHNYIIPAGWNKYICKNFNSFVSCQIITMVNYYYDDYYYCCQQKSFDIVKACYARNILTILASCWVNSRNIQGKENT